MSFFFLLGSVTEKDINLYRYIVTHPQPAISAMSYAKLLFGLPGMQTGETVCIPCVFFVHSTLSDKVRTARSLSMKGNR